MSSFLSAASKANIDSVLDRLHDTFKTEIFVYIAKKEDFTADPTFNSIYGKPSISRQSTYNRVMEKQSVMARVLYPEKQMEVAFSANVPNSKGLVRIKVDSAGSELVKIAAKVEIDGVFYTLDSDAAVVGMFSDNYFIYYLKRES